MAAFTDLPRQTGGHAQKTLPTRGSCQVARRPVGTLSVHQHALKSAFPGTLRRLPDGIDVVRSVQNKVSLIVQSLLAVGLAVMVLPQ